MTALDRIHTDSRKPADLVAVLAQVEAFLDVVNGRKSELRDVLEEAIYRLETVAGDQVTIRGAAGKAMVVGGNPKVRVSDPQAHAPWADQHGQPVEAKPKVDESRLLKLLRDDPDLEQRLREADVVTDTFVFSEDHEDWLLDTFAPHNGPLVDPDTGERVPGVEVSYTSEYLRVSPDKAYRDRVKKELLAQLPALDNGGQS